MTADVLAMTAGAILSLLFSYAPKVSDWFEALESTNKRLVMLVLLALVGAGTIGIACAGYGQDLGVTVTCDRAGGVGTLKAFFMAAFANQTTYLLTKPPAPKS